MIIIKRTDSESLIAHEIAQFTLSCQNKKQVRIICKIKRGNLFLGCNIYGRFLRTSIMTAPIMATNMNKPTIAGTKYRSAIDAWAGAGVAVAVGAS